MKILISICLLLTATGCSSILSLKNPDIEYDKTASLLCEGNYKVSNNGKVTNSKIEAFDFYLQKENELHPLAAQNFDNLLRCMTVAKKYAIKYDLHSNKISDEKMFEFRQYFLSNFA